MQNKGWIVYSQNSTIGPLTSARLRDMLRSGEIDPFDMVSLEGSAIRVPIVEADQIFETEREISTDTKSSSATQAAVEELISGNVFGNNFHSKSNNVNQTMVSNSGSNDMEVLRPRRFEALAINSPQPKQTKIDQRPAQPQRRPKKYFLIDRNQRNFGPLDPSEILNMWLRGNMDESMRVERVDSQNTVPIRKFVETYLKAKNPSQQGGYERAKNAGIPQLQPQPMVAQAMVQKSNSNNLLFILGLVAIVGAVVLGCFAFLTRQKQEPLHVAALPQVQEEPDDIPAPADIQAPAAPEKMVPPVQIPKRRVIREFKPLKPIAQVPTPTMAPPVLLQPPTPSLKPTLTPAPKPILAKKAPPKRLPPKKAAKPPAPADSPAPKLAAAAPAPKAPPAKAPAAALTATKSGPLTNGPATIGPYSYNPMAIDSCAAMKCRLPMDGPNGPIVAVFFKGAYANTLKRKNGSATLTGRADNSSGVTLFYIESVK